MSSDSFGAANKDVFSRKPLFFDSGDSDNCSFDFVDDSIALLLDDNWLQELWTLQLLFMMFGVVVNANTKRAGAAPRLTRSATEDRDDNLFMFKQVCCVFYSSKNRKWTVLALDGQLREATSGGGCHGSQPVVDGCDGALHLHWCHTSKCEPVPTWIWRHDIILICKIGRSCRSSSYSG